MTVAAPLACYPSPAPLPDEPGLRDIELAMAEVLQGPTVPSLVRCAMRIHLQTRHLTWADVLTVLSHLRIRQYLGYRRPCYDKATRRQHARRLAEVLALVRRHLACLRGRSHGVLRVEHFAHGFALPPQAWLWTDASIRANHAGLGLVLETADNAGRFTFGVPLARVEHSGQAELAAFQAGLALAQAQGIESLRSFTDSDYVLHVLKHDANALNANKRLVELIDQFNCLRVYRIARVFNHEADALAARAHTTGQYRFN